MRHQLGVSIEEMGTIRYMEMLKVKEVLGLTDMLVLDLPDGELAEMDPREIEAIVTKHIRKIEPQILVTYAVHGVSGFHDHLVTHAVVKRVYLEIKDEGAAWLRRLAFVTIPNATEVPVLNGKFLMKQSDPSRIDCEVLINDQDKEILKKALYCYETYREIIEKSGVIQMVQDRVYFEIYGEDHKPPLPDLTASLP